MANVAIIGGSRGIGEAVARHLVAKSERLFSISRTVSKYGEWIKADVSTLEGVNTVAEAVGEAIGCSRCRRRFCRGVVLCQPLE